MTSPYREPDAPTREGRLVLPGLPPGSPRPLAAVDVAGVLAWLTAIPYERWPQQHRLADGKIRPAMVSDLAWEGFAAATDALVAELMVHETVALDVMHGCRRPGPEPYNRMLSAVMPGHAIEPHRDAQPAAWMTRVHVPLLTNDRAVMRMAGVEHHLAAGTAYLVDTRVEHAIRNGGETPRVHFMFDVRRSQ